MAIMLLLVLSAGIFGAGIMVLRVTNFNRVSIEARALGVEKLEEVSARPIADIAMAVPFSPQTNYLQRGEAVVRTVNVTGHTAVLGVETNLKMSAYMEIGVNVSFVSPITRVPVTNTFVTLVE